jgi:hypothetical protein
MRQLTEHVDQGSRAGLVVMLGVVLATRTGGSGGSGVASRAPGAGGRHPQQGSSPVGARAWNVASSGGPPHLQRLAVSPATGAHARPRTRYADGVIPRAA